MVAQSFSYNLGGAFLLIPLALLILAGAYAYWQKRVQQEALEKLLARYPGWTQVNAPCGIPATSLAGRSGATPEGDRRVGVVWGIGGPMPMSIAGRDLTVDASLFRWFREERSHSSDSNGRSRTSYRKVYETVGMLRLPTSSPDVRIGSESFFGRMGLTRGGEQVESSEFNRRFRVDGGDRTLTVQLLDANLQRELLERFMGRSIDFTGDLLVLGGRPAHRDESLGGGFIREYPAVRQDLERLVSQVPPQFWRAIGADRPPAADPPPPAPPGADAAPPPPPTILPGIPLPGLRPGPPPPGPPDA